MIFSSTIIIDYVCSLLGYKMAFQPIRRGKEEARSIELIHRNPQLKLGDHRDGRKRLLVGGICVELKNIDSNLEIGLMAGTIYGVNTVKLEPGIESDEDEYVFVGDLTSLDYFPYRPVSAADDQPH